LIYTNTRKALAVTLSLAFAHVALAAEEEAPAQFDVMEYRVLGNTLMPNTSIERAVYSHLGPAKTFADVEAARLSLEHIYREAGYGTVFVDVPEQQVEGGIVRLRVTEGKLDRVRVTGARYFANGHIRAAVPALTSGQVPKLPEVQTQLAALNRGTADRSVVPVLKAGRAPGTVDVELKVTDSLPLHGSVELNNRYTADTAQLRLNGSLSYDNLFQRQQSLSLQYQTAPQERSNLEAIVGTYVFRVPTWNTAFALYAVDSKTDVATLGTLSVIGNGKIFGLRAIRTLPDGSAYSHNVSFGLDYKDFLEDVTLPDESGLTTPIRYLSWSTAYSGTLRSERATSGIDLSANFGVRGLLNHPVDFENKRFKGAANYFYVRGGAQQVRSLPWTLQLFGRVSGQFTQSPLISNEQFAIGGVDTVRGYLESSQLGDYGVNGTFELRTTLLSKWLQQPLGASYFLIFYDAGVVSLLDTLPSQISHFQLASWGAGFRVNGWHGLDLALDYARALKDAANTDSGDQRAHFSFKYAF